MKDNKIRFGKTKERNDGKGLKMQYDFNNIRSYLNWKTNMLTYGKRTTN